MAVLLIIVLLLVGIGVAVGVSLSSNNTSEEKVAKWKEVTTEPYILTDMNRLVFDLYIAGIKHHCSDRDIGLFTGAVYNETSNPADKKAMAVINAQKKLLGYIPAKRLDEYWEWCGGETRYCVGYIFWNGNMLLGRVRVYPAADDLEKARADAAEYAAQVVNHFKWDVNEDGSMK